MEESLNIEQPNLDTIDKINFEEKTQNSTETVSNLTSKNDFSENSIENQDGSMIGKFKNAKNLLDAYNNLQSEFTRKSQKLAEFQKKNDEFAFFDKYDNVDDFISATEGSDTYKEEMLEILNDDKIKNLPNKYLIAYEVAKYAKSNLAKNLDNPKIIEDKVMNNDELKQKVIMEYLSSLNKIPTPPNIVSGNSNSVIFSPEQSRPTTIKQAGEIFSKMLK